MGAGIHLASLDGDTDHELIKSLLAAESFGEEVWIGFNDKQQEGNWVWTERPNMTAVAGGPSFASGMVRSWTRWNPGVRGWTGTGR